MLTKTPPTRPFRIDFYPDFAKIPGGGPGKPKKSKKSTAFGLLFFQKLPKVYKIPPIFGVSQGFWPIFDRFLIIFAHFWSIFNDFWWKMPFFIDFAGLARSNSQARLVNTQPNASFLGPSYVYVLLVPYRGRVKKSVLLGFCMENDPILLGFYMKNDPILLAICMKNDHF